ncbi:MAG: DUF2061 domain-containing protein [Patescibacteria group bacterium]
MPRFFETHLRTIVKTILWRLVATVITFCIVYLYNGGVAESAKASGVVALFLIVGYYLNERVWNRIDWGRSKGKA